ncbi:hypothetical protein CNEO4_1670009 [Clostridium neonatale]|nr:hypothetical protein CNEO4_1670009 [Clostridium neonatale]
MLKPNNNMYEKKKFSARELYTYIVCISSPNYS